MRLRKVISGGQTGADRTGLECARDLGLETGGTVPHGWRTDVGPDPRLVDFGCEEHPSKDYQPRTIQNVRDADATVWFGNQNSPGGQLTCRTAIIMKKPLFINPSSLREIAEQFEVINVAGNRARTNPEVVEQVRAAFKTLEDHE